jgi:hypothetical protein
LTDGDFSQGSHQDLLQMRAACTVPASFLGSSDAQFRTPG